MLKDKQERGRLAGQMLQEGTKSGASQAAPTLSRVLSDTRKKSKLRHPVLGWGLKAPRPKRVPSLSIWDRGGEGKAGNYTKTPPTPAWLQEGQKQLQQPQASSQ